MAAHLSSSRANKTATSLHYSFNDQNTTCFFQNLVLSSRDHLSYHLQQPPQRPKLTQLISTHLTAPQKALDQACKGHH